MIWQVVSILLRPLSAYHNIFGKTYDYMMEFYKSVNKQKGFTLIEMMVAVSIFVIVAFIVVSTLLTMSYAYKKAQKMRLIMDNFNFAIQSMSLSIREGINYDNSACSADKDCLAFLPIDSWATPSPDNKICYKLENETIKICDGSCVSCSTSIISSDIKVTRLLFDWIDTSHKEKMKIFIEGKAGTGREETNFSIQTTITQRNYDL